MDLKNKNKGARAAATFLVPMAYRFPYATPSISNENNDAFLRQNILNSSENFGGIDQLALKKIEADLKLTFLSEKDENSLICMANSPEVRDDFKDIFNFNDLRDYIFAVSQSPDIHIKQKDLPEIKTVEIPYPKTTDQFWKLVNLGSRLRLLKFQESDQTTDQKTTAILNEIAKQTSIFL